MRKPRQTHMLSSRVTPAQHRFIQAIADRRDLSFSEALREILDEAAERYVDPSGVSLRDRLVMDDLQEEGHRLAMIELARRQALERDLGGGGLPGLPGGRGLRGTPHFDGPALADDGEDDAS